MVAIIYIQRKVRVWKNRIKNKGQGAQIGEMSDLNQFFKKDKPDQNNKPENELV